MKKNHTHTHARARTHTHTLFILVRDLCLHVILTYLAYIRLMAFNAIFNNIPVISWRSVSLIIETLVLSRLNVENTYIIVL